MVPASMEKTASVSRSHFKTLGDVLAINAGATEPRLSDILGRNSPEAKLIEQGLKGLADLIRQGDVEGARERTTDLALKSGSSIDRALLVVVTIQNIALTRAARAGLSTAQLSGCASTAQDLFGETIQHIRAVHGQPTERSTDSPPIRPADRVNPLTARERQIVSLLMQGLRTREIATMLDISTKTVEAHRSHAMTKLKVRNVAQLVFTAFQLGVQPTPISKDRPR